MMKRLFLVFALSTQPLALGAGQPAPDDYTALFNERDFAGWKVPEGDNGHWSVIDGVIDYDAGSEAAGDKNLWTEWEYGDFQLMIDWRITATPFVNRGVPLIKPDGSHKRNERGEEIRIAVPDSDSGLFLRGHSKCQVNIWCWPIGSGEAYGYRIDGDMPPEVRAGVTPITAADNDIGAWNTFIITMKGERLTVVLNDITVIDDVPLPGAPARGPIGLQHHGTKNGAGEWVSSPSLVQFRNIFIREL